MYTKQTLTPILRIIGLLLLCAWMASCDGGGGGDSGSKAPDVGSNDVNTVLCVGDSITRGTCAPAGDPYPARLAALSGKRVYNEGVCGAFSKETANRAPGHLRARKPGYICILVGANDATVPGDVNYVGLKENIRYIIQSARAQKTIPIVATLLPMAGVHSLYRGRANHMSDDIRSLAAEENVALVDLLAEFGNDESLLQPDGLHPSDMGTQIMAAAFNDKIANP